jgi:recombination protein RecT
MATALATIREKQAGLVAYFEDRQSDFEKMMEGGKEQTEKFMRVMKNALIRDPQIAEASTQSVFLECQKCAQDGLVLDGREAVLTRFKTKRDNQWVTEVVYVPMIKGLQKLVSQSPQIADWHTGLVYEKEYEQDRFVYEAGDTPVLKHKPIIVGERGPVVAAYSVVRLRSGVVKIEVMTRGQLDGIKNRSKSKTKEGKIVGPWASDEEEMQRKTVARRHFKSLPLTDKLSQAFERVDAMYDLNAGGIDDAPPVEQPKSVINKRKTSAKEKLSAARPKPQETIDGETGEIIDGDAGDGDPGNDGSGQVDDGNFDPNEDEF